MARGLEGPSGHSSPPWPPVWCSSPCSDPRCPCSRSGGRQAEGCPPTPLAAVGPQGSVFILYVAGVAWPFVHQSVHHCSVHLSFENLSPCHPLPALDAIAKWQWWPRHNTVLREPKVK